MENTFNKFNFKGRIFDVCVCIVSKEKSIIDDFIKNDSTKLKNKLDPFIKRRL